MVNDAPGQCAAEGDEGVRLSFHLVASDAGIPSRSDDSGHDEVDSELRIPEDALDVSDLDIYVFARSQASAGQESLIARYSRGAAGTVIYQESPGVYTVTFGIARSILDEISADAASDNISFRILVVANTAGAGNLTLSADTPYTYSQILNLLNDKSVDISSLYTPDDTESDDAADVFRADAKIPMWGTAGFNVSLSALKYTQSEMAVSIGEIYLLRAVAKVRVIDSITGRNADGFPYVASAAIVSSRALALILPAGAESYVNGSQVHSANIMDADTPLLSDDAFTYRLGKIPAAMAFDADLHPDATVRIGYIPEQKIDYADGNIEAGLPAFRIRMALSRNADGSISYRNFLVPMKAYRGIAFDFGSEILRNHIYTLSVNSITPEVLTVKARITPWIEQRHHINL